MASSNFIILGIKESVKSLLGEIEMFHPAGETLLSSLQIDSDLFSDRKRLTDDLSNLIAQHRDKSGNNGSLNIFVLTELLSEEDADKAIAVYQALENTKGLKQTSIRVVIVALAYDLSRYGDVTLRPERAVAKRLLEMEECPLIQTNILYLNNQDFEDKATNMDAHRLARMLSRLFCLMSSATSNYQISGAFKNKIVAVGYAERQYQVTDICEYLRLKLKKMAVESFLADKRLLKDESEEYFNTPYDYKKPLAEQPDCWQKKIKSTVASLRKCYGVVNGCSGEAEQLQFVDCEDVLKAYLDDRFTQKGNAHFEELIRETEKCEQYLRTDEAYDAMRESVERKTESGSVHSIPPVISKETKNGCLLAFWSKFKRRSDAVSQSDSQTKNTTSLKEQLDEEYGQFLELFKELEDYENVCKQVEWGETEWKRADIALKGKVWDESSKSETLIDKGKVDAFALQDTLADILPRWEHRNDFKELDLLIARHVDDAFYPKYKVLAWDNSDPFVIGLSTPEAFAGLFEPLVQKSRPFIGYARMDAQDINQQINFFLVSDCHTIKYDKSEFDECYHLNMYIQPLLSSHMDNTIGVFQLLNISKAEDVMDCIG